MAPAVAANSRDTIPSEPFFFVSQVMEDPQLDGLSQEISIGTGWRPQLWVGL